MDPLLVELVKIRVSQSTAALLSSTSYPRRAGQGGDDRSTCGRAAWWECAVLQRPRAGSARARRTGHRACCSGTANLGRRLPHRRTGVRDQLAGDRDERLEPGRRYQPLPGCAVSSRSSRHEADGDGESGLRECGIAVVVHGECHLVGSGVLLTLAWASIPSETWSMTRLLEIFELPVSRC